MKNIAIITGASSGLGRAYAKTLLKADSNENIDWLDEVWVIARRKAKLEELSNEFAYPHIKLRIFPLDLSKSESFERLAETLSKEKPYVRYLINCAGVEYNGNFGLMTRAKVDSLIDLNIKATTKMISICGSYFGKETKVINISSITSFVPTAGLSVYSASKSYISYLTRALREEAKVTKSGVKYLCIYPGNMNTEMNRKDDPDHSKIVQKLPWLDINKIIDTSLKLVKKGRACYTPGLFYKNFRIISKILPKAWLIPLFKVEF